MNPDDGARLGLGAGARALIRNEYGAIESEVEFDARLRPGVNVNALAPHGPGSYDPVSCIAQVTAISVEVCAAEVPR
jgi:formate dehydrogenase